MSKAKQHEPITRPEIDFDVELNRLEFEWRQGYEASIAARAAYQALAANRKVKVEVVDAARERLDRAEAVKSRIMAKIERLEDHILRRG
jgi:thymidylate kinase